MLLAFQGFELDLERGRLLRAGREVPLERRVFELLCFLAQNPERLITKDELMREVWRVRSLSASVMGNTVAKLRRALGQDPEAASPIETVRGRGYRFWPAGSSELHALHADPFCGRDDVMGALERTLERARAGQSSATVLSGGAGIGKTRVASELGARARERGFVALFGAAYDGDPQGPYWPFTQMLRQAREALSPEAFERHVPPDAAALGLILPELAPESSRTPLELAAVRFQLFDEVTRTLASLSRAAPLLLVFDDLHWADRAAIELFNFVARTLRERGVALLGTLRADELSPLDERAGSFATLDRLTTRIALAGLSLEAVAAVASALGRAHVASEALHARTGGNPLFTSAAQVRAG